MNPMEQLAKKLQDRFPDALIRLDPHEKFPDGQWWYLNFAQMEGGNIINDVVVEYRDNSFGFTANRPVVPYESADEWYDDLDGAYNRLEEIIDRREITRSPGG